MTIQGENGEITLASHVMRQALRAAEWIGPRGDVTVAMLVPENDPLLEKEKYHKFNIFEGPEDDVLARYHKAMKHYNADFIVRLTGDCAWIQAWIIHKIIFAGLKFGADYTSNILVRSFAEGLDVEMMSSRLLTVLNKKVVTAFGREHVTSDIQRLFNSGDLSTFVFHTVMSEYDYSDLKTSIDTKDEYDRCNDLYEKLKLKRKAAKCYGSVST
jgi:spore coat polysaccharide biosynthesis protein SpsF (cytidylyltransferase family)